MVVFTCYFFSAGDYFEHLFFYTNMGACSGQSGRTAQNSALSGSGCICHGISVGKLYYFFCFFKKKRQLPYYYIALLLSLFVFNIADIWGAVQFLHATIDLSDAWGVLRDIIHMAIWIPYFRVSKRVKLTFVN
ncbi:hypothetical protein CRG95_08255 [Escherichia sp. E4208]|nr:hypothetical protein CRG95_08255 [Escherichia sp. E4208]